VRLVAFASAKRHLRMTWLDDDPDYADEKADLELKVLGTEAAILRYVDRSAGGRVHTVFWLDPTTTPADVQAAVLIQLGEYWRFRGDDAGAVIYSQGRDPGDDFAPAVVGLLRRYCDPVLA
jgi:hypothetical protein